MAARGFLWTSVTLAVVTAWTYWPTLVEVSGRWATDPQYSHGYIVPLFSAYLLWSRRRMLDEAPLRPNWWGLGFLAIGLAVRWFGVYFHYVGLDSLSLIPTLAGIALVAGGLRAFRWAGPGIAFLIFMVPLPYRIQTAMSGRLQRIATDASTYLLQTFGYPAIAEGNIIVLDNVEIGVVEACSGLGMVYTFAALSAGVAMVSRSAWWVRLALLVGALPVAVVANVARITATGILYQLGRGEEARAVFHDVAGWLMMPFGVLLVLGEMYVLNRAIVDRTPRPHGGSPLPL